MSMIATGGCLGRTLLCLLTASSGPLLALAGFFGGGTAGGLLGALAVAALGRGRA
ncbi:MULTISPECIES: hypothetical protein [Methylobacterium]|uniref:hypothetical protein n=1 Tax=Methylobacterium TaxID=407 RepID=UPI000365B3D4|nr:MULTISPECIES: hypothetical protein [Methylobacterium]MBN4094385.1 hypothetical protein [Methylobacterium sp. OT2]UIN33197.1 hypothetical protein LXM90_19135 [Methylobacterium oryzae]